MTIFKVRESRGNNGDELRWMCPSCREARAWNAGICATCGGGLSDEPVIHLAQDLDEFLGMIAIVTAPKPPVLWIHIDCPACGSPKDRVDIRATPTIHAGVYALRAHCSECPWTGTVDPTHWMPR